MSVWAPMSICLARCWEWADEHGVPYVTVHGWPVADAPTFIDLHEAVRRHLRDETP